MPSSFEGASAQDLTRPFRKKGLGCGTIFAISLVVGLIIVASFWFYFSSQADERMAAQIAKVRARGEPLTTAAIREAREECGLDVRLDGLVNIYSYAGRIPVIVVYAATALAGVLTNDDESLETAEFDRGSLPWGELAFRSTEEGLRDYLAGLRHPIA